MLFLPGFCQTTRPVVRTRALPRGYAPHCPAGAHHARQTSEPSMHLDECALNRRLSNPAAQTTQMAAIRAAPLWPRASLAAMARGEPAGRLNRLEYQKVARRRDFFRRFENRQQRVPAVQA